MDAHEMTRNRHSLTKTQRGTLNLRIRRRAAAQFLCHIFDKALVSKQRDSDYDGRQSQRRH